MKPSEWIEKNRRMIDRASSKHEVRKMLAALCEACESPKPEAKPKPAKKATSND